MTLELNALWMYDDCFLQTGVANVTVDLEFWNIKRDFYSDVYTILNFKFLINNNR